MSDDIRTGDLRGARFHEANLRGARFVACDVSGVVMRGVDAAGLDIDSPWLFDGPGALFVNGVDVVPYVDAELDRRFPGRDQRRAETPQGLQNAWVVVQQAWAFAVARVGAMPPGTVDVHVAGEWSFAQTLRHLVHATDVWLGKAVQQSEQPFHPLGLSDDASVRPVDPADLPPYDDVLAARADRVEMVRGFLADVMPAQLDEERRNPHSPEHPETVRSCLHVILEEEWEHLRFALRDLDAIALTR